jgi:hypothetical protein
LCRVAPRPWHRLDSGSARAPACLRRRLAVGTGAPSIPTGLGGAPPQVGRRCAAPSTRPRRSVALPRPTASGIRYPASGIRHPSSPSLAPQKNSLTAGTQPFIPSTNIPPGLMQASRPNRGIEGKPPRGPHGPRAARILRRLHDPARDDDLPMPCRPVPQPCFPSRQAQPNNPLPPMKTDAHTPVVAEPSRPC